MRDHSVLIPTLRASKRLDDTWRIDVIADYAAGSDTATGSAGKPIVVGDESFAGGVDVDFDLLTVRIEGRATQEISPEWRIEGFVGAALYDVDVTVTAPGGRASDHRFEAGPHFGGRIGWLPRPRLQVYGEGYIVYLFPDGIVPLGEFEVGVEYKAAGAVSLLGGWRIRNLELVLEGSDFDFEWSGPYLGLALDF